MVIEVLVFAQNNIVYRPPLPLLSMVKRAYVNVRLFYLIVFIAKNKGKERVCTVYFTRLNDNNRNNNRALRTGKTNSVTKYTYTEQPLERWRITIEKGTGGFAKLNYRMDWEERNKSWQSRKNKNKSLRGEAKKIKRKRNLPLPTTVKQKNTPG